VLRIESGGHGKDMVDSKHGHRKMSKGWIEGRHEHWLMLSARVSQGQ
jgi:hypothetical protein